MTDFESLSPTPSEDEKRERNCRDVTLMLRVKDGDVAAFEELVNTHQDSVVGTVSKMLNCPNDAEDIAQQVFIRVWKSAARYEPQARFKTWLFTITRNLVFNEVRRRIRKPSVSMEEREEEFQQKAADLRTPSPDDSALQNELLHAIDAAIAELPDKQRMAVILRRYEEMPYEDIARVLEMTVPAVKSLLFRARTQLKESLREFLD